MHLRLAPDPHAPRRARDALRDFDGLSDDILGIAGLLVSELVTNSVRHAGLASDDAIELTISAGDVLRVEVTDAGPGPLQTMLTPSADDDHGRGLLIVSRLARSWGIDLEPPGRVWFELDLSANGSPRLH